MALDPMIKRAIMTAVEQQEQATGVSQRFIRWFEAVSSGSEDLANVQSANGHLEALFDTVEVPDGSERGSITIDVSDI